MKNLRRNEDDTGYLQERFFGGKRGGGKGLAFEQAQGLALTEQIHAVGVGGFGLFAALCEDGKLAVNGLVAQAQDEVAQAAG